jgi:hypothetical protein
MFIDLPRYKSNAAYGVKAEDLFFGEWWSIPQFDGTKQQYRDFADAQKLMYSKGAGNFYWTFKVRF